MPIGKNALKRVSNNGYSNVSVSAPDMENSTVVETPAPVESAPAPEAKKAPKAAPKTAKQTNKTATAKTAPKKNTAPKEKKPATPAPKIEKVEATSHPDGFVRYALGSDLPEHLL